MEKLLSTFKEYGGIGDFDTVTRSLHRSGAIPSHFVSTLHRQRKFLFFLLL